MLPSQSWYHRAPTRSLNLTSWMMVCIPVRIRAVESEILTWAHNVEIKIRDDFKNGEHFVKHLAMLTGDTNLHVQCVALCLQRLDNRCHFDCFRTGSKSDERSRSQLFNAPRPQQRPVVISISVRITPCIKINVSSFMPNLTSGTSIAPRLS